ncbi:MAG: hypothetical protein ACX93N_08095 [Pseudohaliea sp.]
MTTGKQQRGRDNALKLIDDVLAAHHQMVHDAAVFQHTQAALLRCDTPLKQAEADAYWTARQLNYSSYRYSCSIRVYQLAVSATANWLAEEIYHWLLIAPEQLRQEPTDLSDFSPPPRRWLHRLFMLALRLNNWEFSRQVLFDLNDLLFEWLPAYGASKGLPTDGHQAPAIADFYSNAARRRAPRYLFKKARRWQHRRTSTPAVKDA